MFICGRTLLVWQGGLIILLVFLAYLPALRGGFVWDDDAYVTQNPTLHDGEGLRQIWFAPGSTPQYYPLSFTSFWVDYQFWEFWTTPYHVENVLLHVLAALLFWRLLLRLQVPGAWLAGALFALHPVMVESVAWITERKNVLSLVFYLGALLAYLRYAHSVADGEWPVASGPPSSDFRLRTASTGQAGAASGLTRRVSRVTRHFFTVWLLSCFSARCWPRRRPFRCRRSFC